MEITHIIAVVFCNRVALQYALWAALLFAPLYAFALKPLVRWCRRCAAMKAAAVAVARTASPPPAASTPYETPAQVSSASSKGYLSPVTVGAAPAPFVPIFATSATAASTSKALSRSSIGTQLSPLVPHDSTPRIQGSACSLEVKGTALTLEVEYRSPTQRFVAALRRLVQQRSAALFNIGDSALRSALQSGEVYLHRHASLQLPSQDYLAQRFLYRQRLQEQYDKLNTTDASLEELYSRPAFQEWYAANREQLLREVRLRESFAKWHSVATAFVLVVALMLLPAYSFSMQTDAMQWISPLASAEDEAAVAAAPLVQLLTTRLYYIQSRGSTRQVRTSAAPFTFRGRADVRAMANTAVKAAEYVSVVAAACALVTSCFMPRESGATATVALVSFLLLVMESALVPAAAVKLGLGFLVVFAIVSMSIYRAAA
ncbi:hypothetical protein GH5_00854 [Leishmania sp. Ghana 2012 LV757]|uniref:hypothetical protein n=1 Tax=Leishmania sp. Ghana 2012 LV757 TaxID=2803181 RepID=UPI001B681EC9|nr:hypothetical protein GH5_00854 [Leishmania sp. Ghana 2012 LV757]